MNFYSPIDKFLSVSRENSDQASANSPIGFELDEKFSEYAERAEQIQQDRCGPAEPQECIATPDGFDPVDVWNEVPHVTDSYLERKNRLLSGGWRNQERVLQLLAEDFGEFSQVQAESYLAAQFAFTFGKCKEIVQYEMESLDFETQYETNPEHQAYIFEVVKDVPWVYCEKVDLSTKLDVAEVIAIHTESTVSEIGRWTKVGERQVRNVLPVLVAEGVVRRERRVGSNDPDLWIDNGISRSYLADLLKEKKRLEEQK